MFRSPYVIAIAGLAVFGRTQLLADEIQLGATSNGSFELMVGAPQFLSQSFLLNKPRAGGIDVYLTGFGVDQFTLWLTDDIGPTATTADVLFHATSPFPDTGGANLMVVNGFPTIPGQWLSFNFGLNLEPGVYFLVLELFANTN
jgi:hypothetical protein